MNNSAADPSTAVASRTLITAGFSITNSRRQPTHIEFDCQRPDMFGQAVRYLIVICERDNPPEGDLPNIERAAKQSGRSLVVVCRSGGLTWLSWQEFLQSLGGAVPSWRALGPDYVQVLMESAANKVPAGLSGEAWQIFEDAVADGFEFILGNRVNRLGGRKRGRRVSDMVTLTPDDRVLVLDAKASSAAYNVTWGEIRPLIEYTKGQIARQRGHSDVHGAVLVAKDFSQTQEALRKCSGDFLSDVTVPLAFLKAEALARLVSTFAQEPKLRTSVNWARICCRGGLILQQDVAAELKAAREERYARGEPLRS